MRKIITKLIEGIVIGIANAIPGVSGGTMMVSMGIYGEFVGAISNIFKDFKRSIVTLIWYAIGIACGAVGLAFAIEYLLEKAPFATAMIFIGLIFGGIPLIFSKSGVKKLGFTECLFVVLGIILILALEYLGIKLHYDRKLTLTVGGLLISLLLGIIASGTMIIPGVSGSMVLMILGYYNDVVTNLIPNTIRSLFNFGAEGYAKTLFTNVGILAPFGIGILLGIFFVSKGITKLLTSARKETYLFILGLVVASPVSIISACKIKTWSVGTVISGIITFAIGFGISYLFSKKEISADVRREYEEQLFENK